MTSSSLLLQRLCRVVLITACLSTLGSILGCGANVPSISPLAGGRLRGSIHGGQQPISGSSLQLYAAATTGYGAAATALLSSPVISDANGGFSITGDYTCPSSTSQLYIVATGGNPGLAPGTNNAAIALMAALGPCSLHGGEYTLDPNSFISINEVTTVASVYALAAFMGSDATHLGTSSTNATGLANSFSLVNNLVNVTTGTALAVTPAGNGTAPQATVNTLGNIMAACVNSDGTGAVCAALAAAATPTGGTAPTDTIQGILNVARNPAHNVSALFGLATATSPFQPTLSKAPNDWTLPVTYTGIGVGALLLGGMAIDASGNIWVPGTTTGSAPYTVFELSNNGTLLSGANGYTGGGLNAPTGIAIDPAGDAWVTSTGNVVKLSSSGTILSGANGFTGGGLSNPEAIAVDGQGNAWIANWGSGGSLIKLDNSGNILSGASGFSTGASDFPEGLGIDVAGDVWVANGTSQSVTEFNNSGTVLSGSGGYPTVNISPLTVAFDASGNAWVSTILTDSPNLNNVMKLNSSGMQLSPAGGYPNCISPGIVGDLVTHCIWWSPDAFALDGAGNVWGVEAWQTMEYSLEPNTKLSNAVSELSNTGTLLSGANGYEYTGLGNSVHITSVAVDGGGNVWLHWGATLKELVGAATPVVTPFSLGVKNGTLGHRP